MGFAEPETINGTVYRNPSTGEKAVLMYIRDDKYGILYTMSDIIKGGREYIKKKQMVLF